MDVGMMMVFASYGWENCSDARRAGRGNPPCVGSPPISAFLIEACGRSQNITSTTILFVPDNLQLMPYLTFYRLPKHRSGHRGGDQTSRH